MEVNIIGSNGGSFTMDLSDKLAEIYDSLYLEIDNIKNSYKDICKGIVIDNTRFQHIVNKILKIFKVDSYEILINTLNRLMEDDKLSTHANFIFSKFNISDMMFNSVDQYLTAKKLIISDDLIENLYTIKINMNSQEYSKHYTSFIDTTYNSGFINNECKLIEKKYIKTKELRNCLELNSVLDSIQLIKKKHTIMFNDLKELYISTLNIINIINLALQPKASH
jgi:predicted NAD-dependent protein-ADP-ribosyltransferase YbiA (DUF1768 family)